jgi:preprotein translocase, secE subunit
MVGGSNPSCPATIKVKIMEKFINYIKLSKLEIMKVIFPTKEQIRNAFIAVFIVVAVVSLFLALVDVIMSLFFLKLYRIRKK